jgi:hypothetical protein
MRTRTKWIVAGGAAALAITPVVAVYGSPSMTGDLEQRGLVIDGEAANRARAARTNPTPKATTEAKAKETTPAKATPTAKPKTAEPTTKKKKEPTGKKTVSAASPISPKSPDTAD